MYYPPPYLVKSPRERDSQLTPLVKAQPSCTAAAPSHYSDSMLPGMELQDGMGVVLQLVCAMTTYVVLPAVALTVHRFILMTLPC